MLKNKYDLRNSLAFFYFRTKKGTYLKIFLLEAILAKPEWGIKHECPNCSVRFYDLLKPSPLSCPACGYEFATDVLHRIKKTKLSKDDSDDDTETDIDEDIEEDIEDEIDSADDLLLHEDEEDEDEVIADKSNVDSLDDGLFPDEETEIDTDEIPAELLDDDDLDAEIEEADSLDNPKSK
jgi:hypothetical protein